jgi:hypothetical protein
LSEVERVVSVSLGSSRGDKTWEGEILGRQFRIERIGTNGDLRRFAEMFRELDGQVSALGVGGADIYLVAAGRRYAFRQIQRIVSVANRTPVVDGSGLKHTLEREAVLTLQREGTVDFANERALLVSAVDRFGMAEALHQVCPQVVYGDLMFGLGVPIPIRSYRALQLLARIALPIVTRLPFQWFYPTGEQQEHRRPRFPKVFAWASFICGDKHYIRRYAPDRLPDKTILTQTLRKADLEWFRGAGLRRAITTTPVMGGETFATNVMEGVIVTLLGKSPTDLRPEDYLSILDRLRWKPEVIELNPPKIEAASGTVGPLQGARD